MGSAAGSALAVVVDNASSVAIGHGCRAWPVVHEPPPTTSGGPIVFPVSDGVDPVFVRSPLY